MDEQGGHSEATILVKAAAHQVSRHNELVYCAGITDTGGWVRLYPVSFRRASDGPTFKRWDRVRFRWETTPDDPRPESRRVVTHSMEIIGEIPLGERRDLLNELTVTSLRQATDEGRSLAILRPRNLKFSVTRKTPDELAEEHRDYERIASQIGSDALKPQRPFPYKFIYSFTTDDGPAEAIYQDWEMGETFTNLSESFGEAQTLAKVIQVYGRQYPTKGIVFAMSRNQLGDAPWIINATIGMHEVSEALASNLNVIA